MKKSSFLVCGFQKSPYICNAYHLNQATASPTKAVGIFYALAENNISSVPCGALMRPQPDSGGKQRGAELFSYPVIINTNVSFKCLPK
ncbi:MAG: hypothetical protein IJ328_01795 [Muribaculaceae bacterium]|nr:hypothetical protein [Muribaculaceae bacterium]